jgi:hypothetical protein
VSYGLGFMIESLVAVLLLLTIGYCMILNKRLKRLRADEQALKATIFELIKATEVAERAVAGLRTTAQECDHTLGERLRAAERSCSVLSEQIKAGNVLIKRISNIISAARPLDEVSGTAVTPHSAPTAADAKSVAAAAQAFVERTRHRVGALAA